MSPVAADNHVFFTTEAGAVVVVGAGGDLTPKVVNDLTEDTYATPAIAEGRIYIRTTSACFTRSASLSGMGIWGAALYDDDEAGDLKNALSVAHSESHSTRLDARVWGYRPTAPGIEGCVSGGAATGVFNRAHKVRAALFSQVRQPRTGVATVVYHSVVRCNRSV